MRMTSYPVLGRSWQLRTLLAVLIATGLFLQACSTAGEDATATDDATETATDQATGAPAAEETGGGGGDMLAGVDFDADYCAFRDQVQDSGLMSADPASIEDVDAMLGQATEMYEALAEKAPPEIADDVQMIRDGVSQQMQLMDNLDDPDAAADAMDAMGPEFIEASSRVAQWEAENC